MSSYILNRKRKYLKRSRTSFLSNESLDNWTKQSTKQAIIGLYKMQSKLPKSSLGIRRFPIPDPFLTAFIGSPTSKKFLYHVACHYFGSWSLAMTECELDHISTSSTKFWNELLIIESILALHLDGHELTVKSIWRDRSRRTSKILKRITGKATTGSSLHDAARRYLGSWDTALEVAGIESQLVKEKPFWTKSKIISSIQALEKKGLSLNSQNIDSDTSKRITEITKKTIGKGRTGKSLHGGAYRTFGSWDRALIESGINQKPYRKKKICME